MHLDLAEPGGAQHLGSEFLEDGRSLIVVEGLERFRIVDGIELEALYFEALVTPYRDDPGVDQAELTDRRRTSIDLFGAVVASLAEPPERLPPLDPDEEVSFLLAQTVLVDPEWHQGLLELTDERDRLARLDPVLRAVLG